VGMRLLGVLIAVVAPAAGVRASGRQAAPSDAAPSLRVSRTAISRWTAGRRAGVVEAEWESLTPRGQRSVHIRRASRSLFGRGLYVLMDGEDRTLTAP